MYVMGKCSHSVGVMWLLMVVSHSVRSIAMMRLANDDVGKALHAVLYRRMLSFAQECTPELPGEAFVASWLERFYRDDGTMHILVNMDDSLNVTAHAVIDVQQAMYHYILQCHQLQVDHPDI